MAYDNDQIYSYIEIKKMADFLLNLSVKYGKQEEMNEILIKGSYKGNPLDKEICYHNNSWNEGERRISMGCLLLTNPKSLDIINEKNICLFHGTNSKALTNIIKYGLNSLADSRKLNINIESGEASTRIKGHDRSFISFTDVLDIAENYTFYSKRTKKEGLFPVIIGINQETAAKIKKMNPNSDICEVGVDESIKQENISVIMVPTDKIKIVKKMVSKYNIEVIGIDMIEDRFYAMFDSIMIEFNKELAEEFEKKLEDRKKDFNFSFNEIREFVRENVLSKIKIKESRDIDDSIHK